MIDRHLIQLIAFLIFSMSATYAWSEALKVGFLHENPVGQGGWTLSHERARKKIDAHFGDAIVTSAIDGIAPGVDAERVLTKYARSGTDLVFATSFGFLNPTKKVASRYKKYCIRTRFRLPEKSERGDLSSSRLPGTLFEWRARRSHNGEQGCGVCGLLPNTRSDSRH